MAKIKINMNMDEELLKRIDEYAYSMGINRTSAISVLVSNQLKQDCALSALEKALNEIESVKKIS